MCVVLDRSHEWITEYDYPSNALLTELESSDFTPNIDVMLWKCCSVITLYDPAYACVKRQL